MKRQVLAYFLALTIAVSIAGVSLAEFDYSVFEDNEQFDVEIDVMDDTGKVSFPSGFKPIDTGSKLAGEFFGAFLILIMTDIVGLPDAAVAIRIQFIVMQWPDIKNIVFLPEKTRYTIEGLNKQESLGAGKHETFSILITPDLMPMFDEIIEKQITSVKFRLDGDVDIDGEISINLIQLRILMALYKNAGGMEQDFDTLEAAFPVTVKSM